MAALDVGKKAPDFKLPLMDGKEFSLHDALKHGPVVLAFFKISCPVCQFSFPYLSRAAERLDGKGVQFIGVSQDDRLSTEKFIKQFGVAFPVALEDLNHYTTSNAYGLTNVPTLFLVGQDGTIELSSVGWAREDLENVYRRFNGTDPVQLFQIEEQVPEFKAG